MIDDIGPIDVLAVGLLRHQGTEEEFARAAVAGADQLIAQADGRT